MNFLVLMVAIMLPGSQLQRSLAGGLPLVIPAAKRPEEGGGGRFLLLVPTPGATSGNARLLSSTRPLLVPVG